MTFNGQKLSWRRLALYSLGIIVVSLGIVLCKKCGLGISPISSIPLVLAEGVSLSFGTLTTLFHVANTTIQMVLSNNPLRLDLWMQVPLAFVFGWVINWINALIFVDTTVVLWQVIALILSIFCTALGMVMMIDQNLIQNPPDGTVLEISKITKTDLGGMKVAYDITCVVISTLIGLVLLGKIVGFGVGSVASAIFVGHTITWIRKAWAAMHSRFSAYSGKNCFQ